MSELDLIESLNKLSFTFQDLSGGNHPACGLVVTSRKIKQQYSSLNTELMAVEIGLLCNSKSSERFLSELEGILVELQEWEKYAHDCNIRTFSSYCKAEEERPDIVKVISEKYSRVSRKAFELVHWIDDLIILLGKKIRGNQLEAGKSEPAAGTVESVTEPEYSLELPLIEALKELCKLPNMAMLAEEWAAGTKKMSGDTMRDRLNILEGQKLVTKSGGKKRDIKYQVNKAGIKAYEAHKHLLKERK